MKFNIKKMGFKHTGLFPEQASNWNYIKERISKEKREISVLNLFAYTGGATIAAMQAGARVTHVDSSRGMVDWAKENNCTLITEKEMQIIKDKRAKDKKKK